MYGNKIVLFHNVFRTFNGMYIQNKGKNGTHRNTYLTFKYCAIEENISAIVNTCSSAFL